MAANVDSTESKSSKFLQNRHTPSHSHEVVGSKNTTFDAAMGSMVSGLSHHRGRGGRDSKRRKSWSDSHREEVHKVWDEEEEASCGINSGEIRGKGSQDGAATEYLGIILEQPSPALPWGGVQAPAIWEGFEL
ncbi:hypothetical protein P7K49_029688 [Saguinus oedipus]|uniref:Uncharacterized protein n=1 Tax=Saguinus oedipus TaxID=9490 RepID=A0ABQ9U8P2_SAGOE|nr:hypothetical protein P7K49_029688 [Saguinus oedipus]